MHTTGNWPPPTVHLSERQRQRLLIWAEMALQREAAAPDLPEAERVRMMVEKQTAVSLVLSGVDDLIGHLHEPANDVIDDRLIRIFKNLAWLTGHPAPPAHRQFVRRFKQARAANNQEEAFHSLFQAVVVSSVPPRNH
ncbi:MAG: hypothetical protein IAE79_25010 [Anaerolinea sp.]|nr:hypothetical protein [Anaerolinea sp.]